MPTVPNLEAPQVQAEGLPGRANPRIDDSVSPNAFGAGLAQGLDTAATVGTDIEAKEKIQNDNLRVIDANTQLEAGRNALLYGRPDDKGQMVGGAFSLHGLDAINMPEKLVPQYQSMAQNISSSLTPDQQRLFHPHVQAGSNEVNLQLNRYEYEESNKLAQSVYANGYNQAVESASVGWRDPNVIGKSRADIKGLVKMQGDREGWPQDQRDAQTQKLLAEMHYSVVDRMLADGDPQAALSYFVGDNQEPGIRDSRELTGEQAHQIGSTIDAALRQQGAQNSAAVATKVRDVRSAAVNGQLIPPSAMPSDVELKSAYPDTWQDVKSSIGRDVQMGSDLKSMSAMSPQQIADTVKSYQPDQVTGAAEQYERYNTAASAAQRIQAERAKDPRQFAIDNNLGSAALDLSNPNTLANELRDRVSTQGVLSNQMGGRVPLLSRNEAAALGQTMDAMRPADRLAALNTLATAVQDDKGFQQLMHQIAPNSPVTAIVGNQVTAANPTTPAVWFDRSFAVNPTDQARILAGEQLLNPPKDEKTGDKREAFPMPPEGGAAGLRSQFSVKTDNLFRGRGQLGEAYYQAFKGAYASLLSDKGDMSASGDSRLRDQAMTIALGRLTNFNGQKVSVPQGMDPSRFEGLVNNAVSARAINQGAPPGFADKIRGYQLQELPDSDLGSGQYQLTDGTFPLMRPDGKGPFTIDLRNDYLPGHAHGSPQDSSRQAAEPPATPPGVDSLEGNNRVPRVPGDARDRAIKAPAIHTGGGGRTARDHPSQAPSL